MKVICKKDTLVQAVTNVSRAVSNKSTIPALEGILLQTTQNGLYIAGYDLNLGITTEIEARVEEPGGAVLSAKFFSDATRRMPADEIMITCDEKQLTQISSGSSQFTVLSISAADYPELPAIPKDQVLTLEKELLRNMIDQTIFAVATGDTKPVHTGSLFDIASGVLTVVSVDGYRLALRREKIQADQDFKFIVPGKTLMEVSRLIGSGDGQAMVHLAQRHIVFEVNGYFVISRLLEGDFLDYNASIPKNHNLEVSIGVRPLVESIERAALLISERMKSPLRVKIDEGKIAVSCETSMGKVYDEVACTVEGAGVQMGFNHKYLLDALRNSGCDEVKIQIGGPLLPIKVVPKEGDAFLFLVLPVRIRNE
jgi:DNA polymerase-3 subunit beta